MRAERVVPLFVAVAVDLKQSKHYAYLKSSAMCSHQQQQFTHPESFFFPSILLGSAFGFAGAGRLYSGKDPFCMTRFTCDEGSNQHAASTSEPPATR